MAGPYHSTRTGRFQWMAQRVSALLLVFFAFGHFFLQHFTTDAVSTGLATAARLNDPYWQAYYVVFVVLVLYHGINGVIGIVHDYAPKPLIRGLLTVALWTLAIYFGALGIRNAVSPTLTLEKAKVYYTSYGFPDGESAGNPPNPAYQPRYEFSSEQTELNMLYHYLSRHTHRADHGSVDAAFGPADAPIAERGTAFDRWCLARIDEGLPTPEARNRHAIFSSTYEFALWAANVRQVNARKRLQRGEEESAAEAVLDRLGSAPAYDPAAY